MLPLPSWLCLAGLTPGVSCSDYTLVQQPKIRPPALLLSFDNIPLGELVYVYRYAEKILEERVVLFRGSSLLLQAFVQFAVSRNNAILEFSPDGHRGLSKSG